MVSSTVSEAGECGSPGLAQEEPGVPGASWGASWKRRLLLPKALPLVSLQAAAVSFSVEDSGPSALLDGLVPDLGDAKICRCL